MKTPARMPTTPPTRTLPIRKLRSRSGERFGVNRLSLLTENHATVRVCAHVNGAAQNGKPEIGSSEGRVRLVSRGTPRPASKAGSAVPNAPRMTITTAHQKMTGFPPQLETARKRPITATIANPTMPAVGDASRSSHFAISEPSIRQP
jgi:hypothetical protein